MEIPPEQQPVLIPIHSEGGAEEWAMIELNGELILPKESPHGKENPHGASDNDGDDGEEQTSSLVDPDRVELGSVRFEDKVCVERESYILK